MFQLLTKMWESPWSKTVSGEAVCDSVRQKVRGGRHSGMDTWEGGRSGQGGG